MHRDRSGLFGGGHGFYSSIARLPGLKHSYRGKILLVAFFCTHVPLFALLVYHLLWSSITRAEAIRVLLVALGATLFGTGLILLALTAFLRPIEGIQGMLERYRRDREVPEKPVVPNDQLGSLARETADTIADLDALFTATSRRDDATGALNATGFAAALQDRITAGVKSTLALLELPEFPRWQVALDTEGAAFVAASVVKRLELELPSTAVIGALGRGRFAIALQAEDTHLEERYDAILQAAGEPLRVRGREVSDAPIMGTAGAAYAGDARRLISAAEAALLAAVQHGGPARVEAHDAGEAVRIHIELSMELEQALREQQFYVVYQRRVDTITGHTNALEALLRWQHPTRGVVEPTVFIPLAERGTQIVKLGAMVLEQAVAQAAEWHQQGDSLRVSVNVSAHQLSARGFLQCVEATLDRHSLPAEALELELTESSLLADLPTAVRQLTALRALGIHIALDDFGAGYSSLSYLAQLPLDVLKIDKGFVERLHEPRYRRVVAGIIQLADNLGLRTTAEGVETAAQLSALRELGCTEWQGYLDAEPVRSSGLELLQHRFAGTTNL